MRGMYKQLFEGCNVCANELKVGDRVQNINPECEHYRSIGDVMDISSITDKDDKINGNVIRYQVTNDCDDYNTKYINGEFHPGDELNKTEIQLRKLN
jgi:hypothetical protein